MQGPPSFPRPPESGGAPWSGGGGAGPAPVDRWYLSEGGAVQGPFMWHQIATRVALRQVAPDAMLRNEAWPMWVPLHQHAQPSPAPMNRELQGLIPSRYDAMFYAFLGLFIVGLVVAAFQIGLGILLLVLAVAGEITALVLEIRHRGLSVTSAIGNIIAVILILVQLGVVVVALTVALE